MVGFDFGEEGFGVGLEGGEFVVEGGVEGEVGFLLEGEDPGFFAAADAGPHGHGFEGGVAAELVVADEAADEAVVGGGDAVVGVEVELGEGADVNFEFALGGDGFGEAGVEAVDAFEDDDLVGGEGEGFAFEFHAAGFEVEAGHVDGLAGVEGVEMLVEEGEVDGFDVFEVVVAFFVAGGVFAVDEVVVDGDGDGSEAVDAELDGEAFGEGGLAGGGGSGDEDVADVVAAGGDFVGDAGDFLFVEGFGDADEVGAFFGGDDFVEASDGVDVEDAAPLFVFLVDLEEDGLGAKGRNAGGDGAVGELDDEAGVVGDEFDVGDGAGGVGKRAVGEVGEAFAGVDDDFAGVAVFEEVGFVDLVLFLEVGEGGGVEGFAAEDGVIGGDEFVEALAEEVEVGLGNAFVAVAGEGAVEAGAEGVFDGEGGVGEEIFDGFGEEEVCGGAVDAPAVGVGEGEEVDVAVDFEEEFEGDDHVVDEGAEVVAAVGVGGGVEEIADGGSVGNGEVGSVGEGGGDLIFSVHGGFQGLERWSRGFSKVWKTGRGLFPRFGKHIRVLFQGLEMEMREGIGYWAHL